MPKSGDKWDGFQQFGQGSLIDRLTAETQVDRDAFQYNTVLVNERQYRMAEDWAAVMDRAAAKFGKPEEE